MCRTVPEKNIAICNTIYEKGVIRAESYKNSVKISECSLQTAGVPSKIQLHPEKNTLRPDGRNLCYVKVAVTDEGGTLITDYPDTLSCQVTGGKLEAFFCADPCNDDQFPGPVAHAYKGRALAVISADRPGPITVCVRAADLPESTVEVTAQ